MSIEDLRVMNLSGTVSVPPKLPAVADITFKQIGSKKLVVGTQKLSPKLIVARSFFWKEVKAIFVPSDPKRIDMKNGTWFEDDDLESKVMFGIGKDAIKGIIFVRENAQAMLEMKAGLTAAESVEYYPPLPDDRSNNHYAMKPTAIAPGCDPEGNGF